VEDDRVRVRRAMADGPTRARAGEELRAWAIWLEADPARRLTPRRLTRLGALERLRGVPYGGCGPRPARNAHAESFERRRAEGRCMPPAELPPWLTGTPPVLPYRRKGI
jgi:hypothetical protein